MKIRLATKDDMPAFVLLLRECLLEEEIMGQQVLATRRTVEHYREFAWQYVTGGLFGVLVLAEDNGAIRGFALAGEDTGDRRVESTSGRVAYIWQAYTSPSYRKDGVALSLLIWGRPFLLEMGFETAVMSVLESNLEGQALTLSFGAKPVDRVYHFALKEEPRDRSAR